MIQRLLLEKMKKKERWKEAWKCSTPPSASFSKVYFSSPVMASIPDFAASLHAPIPLLRRLWLDSKKTQKTSSKSRAHHRVLLPLSFPNLKTMMRREKHSPSTHQNYPQFSTFASFSPLLRLGRSQKLSPRTRPRVSRFPFFATTRRAFVSSSPSPSSHVCCCCREERHHHHYRTTRAGFSASSELNSPEHRELCFDEDF